MEKIVLFGAGGHTKYTIDIIERENKYEIAGILAPNLPKGSFFADYEILGAMDELVAICNNKGITGGVIAIGDNWIRRKVSLEILSIIPDFKFVSAIHPSVIIGKNATVGAGTVIMAGVIINNDCTVGQHCFLATKSSLDHDSVILDYTSFSPGVTTGGSVRIGEVTAIGIGANILHGISIGSHTVVGGGSLVTKNIDDNLIVYGVPAKVIRERATGEKYL